MFDYFTVQAWAALDSILRVNYPTGAERRTDCNYTEPLACGVLD